MKTNFKKNIKYFIIFTILVVSILMINSLVTASTIYPLISNLAPNKVSNSANSTSTYIIGYDEIIVVLNGKPKVIPIHRPETANLEREFEAYGKFYYNQFYINNLRSGVKEVYAFSLGLDPSTSIYFLMENGSVRILEKKGTILNPIYTSKEVLSSSNKAKSLKLQNGFLYAITQNYNKIKISEVSY